MIEALFELRFNCAASAASIFPGILYTKLDGATVVEKLPASELPEQLRAVDPNLKFAALVRVIWKNFAFLISDHSIAVACLLPYVGWTEFKPTILRIVGILSETAIVETIERYSLKYVDIIPEEIGNAKSVVNLDLRIGHHDGIDNLFQVRSEINQNGFLHIIQIASSAAAVLQGGTRRCGTAVEVDTIVQIGEVKFAKFLETLDAKLELLHRANKETFFLCLKQEAIDMLEPTYE